MKPIELINMLVAQRTNVLATADAKYAQGDPNCKELPAWPAYTPEDAPTMIFNVKSRMVNAPDRKALELLEPFNPWAMMCAAPAEEK